MTHFRLDVTITSITSGFWPDVTLDGSLPDAIFGPATPRRVSHLGHVPAGHSRRVGRRFRGLAVEQGGFEGVSRPPRVASVMTAAVRRNGAAASR